MTYYNGRNVKLKFKISTQLYLIEQFSEIAARKYEVEFQNYL